MIVGRAKTALIKYGALSGNRTHLPSLYPFSFLPLFSLHPTGLLPYLWPSFHQSHLVKLFKLSPSCLFISSHPVSPLCLIMSSDSNFRFVALTFPSYFSSSCSTIYKGSAASLSPEPGSMQQRLPAHWATSTPSTLSTET